MTKCAPAWRLFLFVFLAFSVAGCSQIKRGSMDEEKDPHYLEGQRRIGGLDWDGAIESFERALQSNPHNSAAHFQLGVLFYTKKQDFAAAIYHYQRHLTLNPKSPMADLVRQHITFSKRELARTDSYPAVGRDVQADLERQFLTNNLLRERIYLLERELARRPAYVTNYVTNFVRAPEFANSRRGTLTEPAEIVAAPEAPEAEREPPARAPEWRASAAEAEPPPRQRVERNDPPPRTQRASATRPAARPETRAETPQKSHTVRPGETLQVLARRYKVSVSALKAANPGTSRGVRAGQKLKIPSR